MARLIQRIRRGVPTTVFALGFVSFFTDVSSEMIYPLIPVFLVGHLGVGAAALGIIEGLAESAAALLKVVSGWWTDRVKKRKPFLLVGYGIAGAVRPLIGFATSCVQVGAIRFTDRVGKGIRTAPRDALIADVTPEDRRGAACGLHRAMDNAGALVGPLIGAAIGLFIVYGAYFGLTEPVERAWVARTGTGAAPRIGVRLLQRRDRHRGTTAKRGLRSHLGGGQSGSGVHLRCGSRGDRGGDAAPGPGAAGNAHLTLTRRSSPLQSRR